jgi:hypothetical protein
MAFRWLAAIALWTLLAGPVFAPPKAVIPPIADWPLWQAFQGKKSISWPKLLRRAWSCPFR